MNRRDILEKLAAYRPIDAADGAARDRIVQFVESHPACFERSHNSGHLTGSAWLIDRAGSRVLLTHHAKLDKWLQLGGHCDGDSDVLRVALKEAEEESGLTDIVPVVDTIFDLDVHPIPGRAYDPPHYHYDIRFIVQVTGGEEFVISDESHELRWLTPDEVAAMPVGQSVLRMRRKWLDLLSSGQIPRRTGKAIAGDAAPVGEGGVIR